MNVNRPHSAMEFTTRNPILKYNTHSTKSILSRKSSLNSGYTPTTYTTKSVSIISPPQSPSVAKLNRHSCVSILIYFIELLALHLPVLICTARTKRDKEIFLSLAFLSFLYKTV